MANTHSALCVELYLEQLKAGRYFLHEQPRGAKTWQFPDIRRLMEEPGVHLVTGHICRRGMMSEDREGPGRVLKPTGWLGNAEEVLEEVAVKCSNIEKTSGQE